MAQQESVARIEALYRNEWLGSARRRPSMPALAKTFLEPPRSLATIELGGVGGAPQDLSVRWTAF
jgi:hypothetical protein